MKARNRDINIFSLSLMDVISGAMGAFLIVMVILSQYYVLDPKTTEDADDVRERLDAAIAGLAGVRKGAEEIFADLIESEKGSSTARLGAGDSAEEIETLGRGLAADIDRVSNHLAGVHAKVSQLEEELQQKSAQLARAADLAEKLDTRRPLAVNASWDCNANVDLFVESDRVYVGTERRGAAFDPRERRQQDFTGDITSDTKEGPGAEMSLVSETPKNSRYKIFVNLMAGPEGVACPVVTHAMSYYDWFFAVPPETTLTFADPFDYLGAITVDDAFKVAFEPPSAETRASELAAVRKRMAETPRPKRETTP